MTVVVAVILAVVFGPSALLLAYALAMFARTARRRRRGTQLRSLSDREVMDALAPFGADISVWPSRAPRNGSAHEPVD